MTAGNGMSLHTVAWELKNGVYRLAQQTFAAPTYVCMGLPTTVTPSEIVSIGNINAGQEEATLSASNRGREETLQLEVTFSVWSGGGDEVEPIIEARVFELVSQLEQAVHYVRGDGTDPTTLGGAVRQCFLTALTQDSMPTNELAAGREAIAIATFTAKARITQ
ncbi:hypothetical protein [Curtobacterium oceanosedimentum]|uniref:hypothetical protein n=1 Tax=Curtobacterium oceanosedimentum TaxID=465820 RepID=UPI0033911320